HDYSEAISDDRYGLDDLAVLDRLWREAPRSIPPLKRTSARPLIGAGADVATVSTKSESSRKSTPSPSSLSGQTGDARAASPGLARMAVAGIALVAVLASAAIVIAVRATRGSHGREYVVVESAGEHESDAHDAGTASPETHATAAPPPTAADSG